MREKLLLEMKRELKKMQAIFLFLLYSTDTLQHASCWWLNVPTVLRKQCGLCGSTLRCCVTMQTIYDCCRGTGSRCARG